MNPFVALGALLGAIAVAAGAFGAHGLEARLSASALQTWETGSRYLMYGALGTLAWGLFLRQSSSAGTAPGGLGTWGPGLCLALGSIVFFGTLAVLSLGGPRIIGAITPVGGAAMILGFCWFALVAIRAGGTTP